MERKMDQDERAQTENTGADSRDDQNPVLWLMLAFYASLAVVCALVMWRAPELRGAGFIGLVIAIGLTPVGVAAWFRRPAESPPSGWRESKRLDHLAEAIEGMTQEAGLTEAAKRVLHRREERELLRREIEQDIADQDWEAAMVLVRELAERFGYRADAEEFRARIEQARAESLDRNVSKAIEKFESLLEQRRWSDAYAEAARIQQLYPESPRVDGLRQRVDEARRRFKVDLERRFLHAAQRDEVDRAMELLKEMDQYLTEEEGERLREVARGVIGKARDNLGARFKLLVEDKAWAEALRVGERIIEEFPNTRMAQEVRDMLDALRARAGESAPTSTAPRSTSAATSHSDPSQQAPQQARSDQPV